MNDVWNYRFALSGRIVGMGICRRRPRRGFTLIELLVVIAVIALLVSLLVPSLRHAKELAKDVLCQSNQHSILIAVQMYDQDYGQLPLQGSGNYGGDKKAIRGQWPGALVVAKMIGANLGTTGAYYKDTVYDCPSNNTRDIWATWTRRLSNDMFPGEYGMNPWIRADERPNPDGPNVNCRDDGALNELTLNPSRVWVTTDCNWTNPDHWPRIATPGYHDGGQAVIAHREANNFGFADGHAGRHERVFFGYNPSIKYVFEKVRWDTDAQDWVFNYPGFD